MSANQDSQEQLQQMAHRAGLHLSEADLAFVTHSARIVPISSPFW